MRRVSLTPRNRILLVVLLYLQTLDFLTTMYIVHGNSPYGCEANPFVRKIVESSPLHFALLYVFAIFYFVFMTYLLQYLERKYKKPICLIAYAILIFAKLLVLANNFYVIHLLHKYVYNMG